MPVFGQTEAERLEKLDMDRQGGKPFLAANHQRRAHKMIVDGVREVIGGNAVRF